MARIEMTSESIFITLGSPDMERRVQALYDLYTAAEDAGAEARDEVASLKDALEMKQVSNDAIDKEAGELRTEIADLKERNKTALGRCASKQRDIDQLDDICKEYRQERDTLKKEIKRTQAELTAETVLTTRACEQRDDNKDALKQTDITIRMLRADKNTLKEKLYVKHYPLEGQIKAEEERDRLQEEVVTLRNVVSQRDGWHADDAKTIQRLFNQIRDLKAEKVRIIHVPLVAMM